MYISPLASSLTLHKNHRMKNIFLIDRPDWLFSLWLRLYKLVNTVYKHKRSRLVIQLTTPLTSATWLIQLLRLADRNNVLKHNSNRRSVFAISLSDYLLEMHLYPRSFKCIMGKIRPSKLHFLMITIRKINIVVLFKHKLLSAFCKILILH